MVPQVVKQEPRRSLRTAFWFAHAAEAGGRPAVTMAPLWAAAREQKPATPRPPRWPFSFEGAPNGVYSGEGALGHEWQFNADDEARGSMSQRVSQESARMWHTENGHSKVHSLLIRSDLKEHYVHTAGS